MFLHVDIWPQPIEEKKLTGEEFHTKKGGASEPHQLIAMDQLYFKGVYKLERSF